MENSFTEGQTKQKENSNKYKYREYRSQYLEGLTVDEVTDEIVKHPIIYEYYKKNKEADQWHFVECMLKAATPGQCSGFVYGFMNQSENKIGEVPYWIKMGMTQKQVPQNRIFQWERDDKKIFTEIFTIRSKYHKKLEKLVHALFAYARQDRVINGGTRKEWFKFHEKTLTAVAVGTINHILETFQEKYQTKVKEEKKFANKNFIKINYSISELNKGNDFFLEAYKKNFNNGINNLKAELALHIYKDKESKERIKSISNEVQLIKTFESLQVGKEVVELFERLNEYEQKLSNSLNTIGEIKTGIVKELQKQGSLNQIQVKKEEQWKAQKPKPDPEDMIDKQLQPESERKRSNSESIKDQIVFNVEKEENVSKLDKYLKTKVKQAPKNENPEQKVQMIKIDSVSRVSEFFRNEGSKKLVLINTVEGQFNFDHSMLNPEYSLAVLTPKIKINEECWVSMKSNSPQKTFLMMFCLEIEGLEKLNILQNEGEVGIFKVFSEENYVPLNDYYKENPQKIDEGMVKKVMKGFKRFL